MDKRELTKEERELIKKSVLRWTDEQIDLVWDDPKRRDILEHIIELQGLKMIAECIESENCSFNKVGDKYVFTGGGSLIKDESCETPCLWAMHSFLRFSTMLYDRVASGLDPNGMHFEYAQCEDTSVRFGGFGKATFKIRFEKVG
jgi:uncharacterized repeat protein (TIGR04076 family)